MNVELSETYGSVVRWLKKKNNYKNGQNIRPTRLQGE